MDKNTIPHIFKDTVSKYGTRQAFREKKYGVWKDISWNEYYEGVRFIAAALISIGMNEQDKVSIIGKNCSKWVMCDMGVQYAGGVSVGIYPTSSSYQIEYILNHSESKFLFLEDIKYLDNWLSFKDKTPLLKKVIVWDTKGLRHFSNPIVITYDDLLNIGKEYLKTSPHQLEYRTKNIKTDDLSVLIYLNTSTGLPNASMITHGNIMWAVQSLCDENRIDLKDETLSFMPLAHIFERIITVYSHIYKGYTVNFAEKASAFMENMMEVSPTIGYGSPRIWEKYCGGVLMRMENASWLKRKIFDHAFEIGKKRALELIDLKTAPFFLDLYYKIFYFIVFRKLKERMGFERLKIAYSGGAPISPKIIMFFRAIGIKVIEAYVKTECTGVTSVSMSGEEKIGTVGKPLKETEIRLAKDNEILIKSKGVFKGYFKNNEATNKTIIDNWLYSGDLGEIDDSGYLKITGRKKDIVITSGGKSSPAIYIEDKLKESPYIDDAILIGDGRHFISCIIIINQPSIVNYCKEKDISFLKFDELKKNSKINILIQKEVEKINEKLARPERIKRFAILTEKLYDYDAGIMPTLKIKRNYTVEAYKDIIDDVYKDRRRKERQ
ncbi:MAG: long-chain fatty acid--CoA ligase [Desulfobacterales bacterium]|nr:long-chain fatty acid--CoA ligase [Desulfobacterales bacterium]